MIITRKNLTEDGRTVKIHPIMMYQPNDRVWHIVVDTPHKNPDVDFGTWEDHRPGQEPLQGFDIHIKPLLAKQWWVNLHVCPVSFEEEMFMASCGVHMCPTKYGAIFTLAAPRISEMGIIKPVQIYPKPRRN